MNNTQDLKIKYHILVYGYIKSLEISLISNNQIIPNIIKELCYKYYQELNWINYQELKLMLEKREKQGIVIYFVEQHDNMLNV